MSAAARILWQPIAALAGARPPGAPPLRLLDVATGAGDVPLTLARRARASGLPLAIEACDISPTALAHAARRAGERCAPIRFFQHDALAAPLPGAWDVIVTSLFLHHLDRPDAVRLLAAMRASARAMIVVNDLERCAAGWLAAWVGTRALSRSPIVHVDGPRSVAAAWTPAEALAIARDTGLDAPRLTRHWPWRWRMVWSAP